MLVNKEELRLHFDGDEELILELLEVFEESYPETLSLLKKSLEESNAKDLELHAHTLKGMVSNFFAQSLKEAAFSLEKMGRSEDFSSEGSAHITILEKGLPELVVEIKSIF